MKTVLYTFVLILLFSCSTGGKKIKDNIGNINYDKIKINSFSGEEKGIFFHFLSERMKSEKYIPYQNHKLVIMEEAESRLGSIYTYEYCTKNTLSNLKNSEYVGCEYNDTIIEILKSKIKKEISYLWKINDFPNNNISLLKTEELRKSIRLGNYTELPERLLIYASVPLIFNSDEAFFYFKSGNSALGFSVIEIITVFMKKNKSGLWEIQKLYFDPNTTW